MLLFGGLFHSFAYVTVFIIAFAPQVVEYRNVESSGLVEGHEESVSDVHFCAFLLHLVTMLCGLVVLCCTSFNGSGFHT